MSVDFLCYVILILLSKTTVCLTQFTFTNTWAVEIQGGESRAKALADKHGFLYLGEILPGIYHFRHRRIVRRSLQPSGWHHRTLAQEPRVKWLRQQVAKKRVRRATPPNPWYSDPMWGNMWYLNRNKYSRLKDMNVQGLYPPDLFFVYLDR